MMRVSHGVTETLYVGVDAGASKCQVRIEDNNGHCLSQAKSAGANIRFSVEKAWSSIHSAVEIALQKINCADLDRKYLRLGMGIAGTEIPTAYAEFIHYAHGFPHFAVASDAHVACLGAHAGRDGAIIIIGTGIVGYQIQQGKIQKVSGWGFPYDDIGSGAWLGMMAVSHAFACFDNRATASFLAEKIRHQLGDLSALVNWANTANAANFATLAPLVIEAAAAQDQVAVNLMQQAAQAVEKIWYALASQQPMLPCALLGGIANHLQSYLSENIQASLIPSQSPPECGAIYLARQHNKEE